MDKKIDGLHNAIMNIRALTPTGFGDAERKAYKEGHRDARHAAAELVAANGATADVRAMYKAALTALETLRGCSASYVEDHAKDGYPGAIGLRPQDVAMMWAQEIHSIDAKAFLDEAIADAAPTIQHAPSDDTRQMVGADDARDAARYRPDNDGDHHE